MNVTEEIFGIILLNFLYSVLKWIQLIS